MRKVIITLFIAAIMLPASALATWQVGNPARTDSSKHAVNPTFGKTDYPARYDVKHYYTLETRKDTLRSNVDTFAAQHGWRVIWRTHKEYYVLIKTHVVGPTFKITLHRLLLHYPLKATYNTKRKIVWISPAK